MILRTVKVKHPDTEGDFMIINETDFDESVHQLFERDGEAYDGLPNGCSLQTIPGGRFKALVGDATLKYPDEHAKAGKDAVFGSQDEAISALRSYLLAVAAAQGDAERAAAAANAPTDPPPAE